MKRIKDNISATGISDEVASYFKFLEELADEWEYSLSIFDNREGEWGVEFGKYTSAGQDFAASLLIDKDTSAEIVSDEVLKELSDYTNYFDAHEQADMWSEVVDYDEDGNEVREGRSGAPTDYNDIVADMEEAKNDLYDFYIDLKRESERFIENNATDWIYAKLDKVKGEFYVIPKKDLNTYYSDEYESFETLGDAVSDAISWLAVAGRYRIVVDADGTILFDVNDISTRERAVFNGLIWEEQYDVILNFLTHEAESLME